MHLRAGVAVKPGLFALRFWQGLMAVSFAGVFSLAAVGMYLRLSGDRLGAVLCVGGIVAAGLTIWGTHAGIRLAKWRLDL